MFETTMLDIANLTIAAEVSEKYVTIVDSFSYSLASGTSVAIIGESGGGKSMIAMAIMGLLPKNVSTSGKIEFNGTDLLKLNENRMNKLRGNAVAIIPQGGHDYLNPSLKIGAQLREVLRRNGSENKSEQHLQIDTLLSDIGFADSKKILNYYPHHLSGGMAQRVLAAIAIVNNPRLLICDEPTRGLDADAAEALLRLIKNLLPDAATLLITHDLKLAQTCDEIIVIFGGKIMERCKGTDFPENVRSPYTKAILGAMPGNGLNQIKKLTERLSAGCSFAPFCPETTEACFEIKTAMCRHV